MLVSVNQEQGLATQIVFRIDARGNEMERNLHLDSATGLYIVDNIFLFFLVQLQRY